MVEREAFLMKPKPSMHLSQQGEWIFGTQSLKERGLLCESMFVEVDGQTLILKMEKR